MWVIRLVLNNHTIEEYMFKPLRRFHIDWRIWKVMSTQEIWVLDRWGSRVWDMALVWNVKLYKYIRHL